MIEAFDLGSKNSSEQRSAEGATAPMGPIRPMQQTDPTSPGRPNWPLRRSIVPKGISDADWRDWRWQMRNRIRTVDALRNWIDPTPEEESAIVDLATRFRFVITPYFASLMDPNDADCPIRKQVVPRPAEWMDAAGLSDPLDEVVHSPVKNVIRVYPDRIAFCVNNECALYCRYCLRKRMVGEDGWAMQKRELEIALDWIAKTPEIRDVLLTGGDPLIFSDRKLEWLLTRLREIPHVELIRLGTRLPVTLPYRVTDALCERLERFHPIWLNTHFNHPGELTQDAADACDRLLRAGIPVGNQSVLLKGVNDSIEVMQSLCETLVRMRVRPYYVYQAQLLEGTEHFRVPIEDGIAIFRKMRGRTSGFAIPQYVLDTPLGKVPLDYPFAKGRDGDDYVVEAWDGAIWREPNPRPSIQVAPNPSKGGGEPEGSPENQVQDDAAS